MGGELVPFRFDPGRIEALEVTDASGDAVVRLPVPARAVYLLYVATCWWDGRGNPVDQYPILVRYADGTASGLTVRIVDWCALDPRAYDEDRRLPSARARPDPQPYWVKGEPLAFQAPALIFGDRGDGKHPIAWLLKIQAPPGKLITELRFPHRDGALWILAITELTRDGTYRAVHSKNVELWDPREPGPYTFSFRHGTEIKPPPLVLRYCGVDAPSELKYPKYMRVVLPSSERLAPSEDFFGLRWYEEIDPQNYRFNLYWFFSRYSGPVIRRTLQMIVGLYDAVVLRAARDLGLEAYRAYPAVLQGVVWESMWTQILMYQPTLGVSLYGPPKLVRALDVYALTVLVATEDIVLRIINGQSWIVPWRGWNRKMKEKVISRLTESFGSREIAEDVVRLLEHAEKILKEFMQGLGLWSYGGDPETVVTVVLQRICGLNPGAEVLLCLSPATGEILQLLLPSRGLPTKGGSWRQPCFNASGWNVEKAWRKFTEWVRYGHNHPLVNAAVATAVGLATSEYVVPFILGMLSINPPFFIEWLLASTLCAFTIGALDMLINGTSPWEEPPIMLANIPLGLDITAASAWIGAKVVFRTLPRFVELYRLEKIRRNYIIPRELNVKPPTKVKRYVKIRIRNELAGKRTRHYLWRVEYTVTYGGNIASYYTNEFMSKVLK